MFEAEGEHADGAVAAHGQAAAGLDEQDSASASGRLAGTEYPPPSCRARAARTQAGADPVEARMKSRRRSAMVAPRNKGAPPATSLTGLPAVCPSMQKNVFRAMFRGFPWIIVH